MGAYLTDHRPAVQQWYATRNKPLTGCTVLHTAESVMDSVGPDTGAEAVARFIEGRATAGSYHDLVDSDSWIPLVDLKHGAFHDGTGSNNWATSLSFACRTTDWARMSPAKRAGFLHQGARAFANQQLYRRHVKAPLTRLRLITKAQSDRGESGFTYHGWRDPGRRTDPGCIAPNLFPIDEFFAACRAELARVMPDHPDAAGVPPQEVPDLDANQAKQLDDVWRMLTDRFHPGQRNSGDMLNETLNQVTAMRAAMTAMAEGTDGVTPDEVEAAVAKALRENTVKVDIEIAGSAAPTTA